eukprot:m.85083 g.85083  ORF g.85083 m.85083 type:complete len:51 (+) comp12773_c0_seq4:1566-1718(+)
MRGNEVLPGAARAFTFSPVWSQCHLLHVTPPSAKRNLHTFEARLLSLSQQ